MNRIVLIGRLTADPELKATNNGLSVCTFTLAVDKYKAEGADFIPIVAWRALAETCAQYLTKGRQAAVTGRLSSRKYTDKGGNNRVAYEVVAEEVQFLGNSAGQQTPSSPQQQNKPAAPGFIPYDGDDDDLPF